MYNRIVRMVPNTYEAEDLVQETFVKVFQRISTFRGEASLGSWIKRIAINGAISHLRKQGRIRWEPWEESSHADEPIEIENSPLDIRQVHEAIKVLPDGCRTVFTLIAVEGWRHQDVAQELDISESTSKTQYRRAKILLRKKLSSYVGG